MKGIKVVMDIVESSLYLWAEVEVGREARGRGLGGQGAGGQGAGGQGGRGAWIPGQNAIRPIMFQMGRLHMYMEPVGLAVGVRAAGGFLGHF